VDLGVFVSGSDSEVEEIDDVGEVGGSCVVEAEESLYREADENLSLEGDESLSLEPLPGAGIRMTLWWKQPLAVSVS
jgi:hypothetical protein